MATVGSRRPKIPAEQRVFSLILALVASPQGLTKRDLLSSVYGYADRYQHGITDPTLERQFERDKDHVRALGIPIETIDSPEESGNTQLTRYRISKNSLTIPADLQLTSDELTLLRLASLAWAEGSLSAESRRATMKLEALGAGVETRHLGVAPSIGITAAQAPALQRAIDAKRCVEFGYQLPDRTQPLRRRVAPLRLHRADGRWHLIAWDLDRESPRVFLLTRILGEVKMLSQTVNEALAELVPGVINQLQDLREQQLTSVLVRTGSTAHARLAPRANKIGSTLGHFQEMVVGTLDATVFTEELAGYGPDVVVCDPPEIRNRVHALLATIRSQHTQNDPPQSHQEDHQ